MQHTTLASERKSWALSQSDLSLLIGCSGDAISNYELGKRRPCFRFALALEILFGRATDPLFKDESRDAAEDLVARAAAFSITIEHADDPASRRKREFLEVVNERLSHLLPAA